MEGSIDTLKFVASLAHDGGKWEAENTGLKAEVARLKAENDALCCQLARKSETIERQLQRISEIEAMLLQQMNNQPRVVVNNVYVLSWPKTVDYVSQLDNNERRFVGHFMHHALPDGTPTSFIKRVDEMTRLTSNHEERLADAAEKLAARPLGETHNHFEGDIEQMAIGDGTTMNHNQ